MAEGVDYAFPPRPDIAGLVAAKKTFACRYGGPGSLSKQLDPAEAQALSAAGVAIVANAEGSADGLRNGFAAGASWARDAQAHFAACGMPPGRPIYFSVDFDTTSGDWAAVDAAMDGAASVIGRNRVGVYGEFSIIEHFAANRKAVWYWQTYAWSGGRWSVHNHIEQYRNGVSLAGATLDLDRALATDFGQWTVGEVVDMTPQEQAELRNVNEATYALVADRPSYPAFPDNDPNAPKVIVENKVHDRLNALAAGLAGVQASVDGLSVPAPTPIDPAALKAVLLDPQVLATIADAVLDEQSRRTAA